MSVDTHVTDGPERIGMAGVLEELGPIPCPTEGCDGVGQRIKLAGRAEIDVICEKCQVVADEHEHECERAARIENLLARSGMTPLLETWTLDTYRDACADPAGTASFGVAVKWIESYLNRSKANPCPNLWFYGPVGGGKTGLAWSIVRRLIDSEVKARFVHFPDLLDRMRESFNHDRPTHEAMYSGSVPVLAVDDVGAERSTPWAIEQLLLLVDRRHHRLLPTIFTSNYEPDDLAERLSSDDRTTGDRIVSRMMEGAVQHRINVSDRRLTS